LIGAATVFFSGSSLTFSATARAVGMLFVAAILFCAGVLFSTEE